ncbi:REP-associated tyrosine transposase [Uliginosibacterium sediminicola]|uniref:Transposase n=1 Tax=Uliginosibacterium sediminicola TaxID=2024550 RepID=A0ABU9YY10_9RHOO
MPNYLRAWRPGGTFFFTVNLLQRQGNDLLTRHIDVLRRVVMDVKRRHPFVIHAWVVLPEHLHCVIELPPDDADFALRWRLIKMDFSKAIPLTERRNASRQKRGERGIWQRRYWEHRIRDEADFCAHIDYVHFNPVKHGWVRRVADWPHSTFHRLVKAGVYPVDWAGGLEENASDPAK